MTVLKIKHHEKNYVILSKKPLEFQTLSWEAKGMWSYLMSRPENWNPNVEHLVNSFGTTKKRVWNILGELIEHGLCERGQERLDSGRMGPVFYTIYEEPLFKKCLPHSQKPHSGPPHSGNRPPNKDREIIRKESNKEEASPSPRPKSFSTRIERATHVFTSKEDHDKLVAEHGEVKTEWCYKTLSEWKLDKPKGKWRKSDYLSILRWCVDAHDEKKNKKKPSQADAEENKKTANSLEDFIIKNAHRFDVKVEALHKHIEFGYRSGNYQPTCIPYHEHGFIDRLESACHKYQIPWRKSA